MLRMLRIGVAGVAVWAAAAVACNSEFVLDSARSGAPPDTSGMLRIEGGEFTMGTDDGYPFEGPAHRVVLGPFYIDEHEVTNGQYAEFVEATDYVTESERLGWSGVFDPIQNGWTKGDGADWRKPHGPGSSYTDMLEYPVVHLSWQDADAYCGWRGARLPSEAEFEFAARGGLEGATYAWGNELTPGGVHQANLWQGTFPQQDRTLDGYGSHGPVKKFPPNGYGLYDMTGNVWEWVNDWYAPDYFSRSPIENPRGPRTGEQKVQRGGSWLCSQNYCQGYRVAARMLTEPDSGLNNLGFRCAGNTG